MGKKIMEEYVMGYFEDLIEWPLQKYPEGSEHDWKLWLGIILASLGMLFLLHLVCVGKAVMKDGWSYGDEEYLARVSYGFTAWRWGINFIGLTAAQYEADNAWKFYMIIITPVLVETSEKILFLLSFNCHDYLDKNYFNDDIDIEKDEATSRTITCQSIYEKFEPYNNVRTFLVFISQFGILVFYMCGIQTKLNPNEAKYPYVFWVLSLAIQQGTEITGAFGQDFDFEYWAFMVNNAGSITLENQETKRVQTPTPCGVFVHFFLALSLEMFGRSLLISTLPLFLMTSEDPIEFMLNCVATGFVVALSQSAQGDYKLTRIIEEVSEDDFNDPEKSYDLLVATDSGTVTRKR